MLFKPWCQTRVVGKEHIDSFQSFGTIYTDKADYDNALNSFNKALSYKSKNLVNNARVWRHIGIIHYKTNEYKKSLSYFEKSLNIADSLGLRKLKSLTLKNLSEVYQKLNQPKKALEYHLAHNAIADSIFNKEKAAQIQTLMVNRQAAENTIQLKYLENDVQQRKKQNTYLIQGFLLLLAIGVVVVIFLQRRNRRLKKQQQVLAIQKNWLKLQTLRNQFKPHFVFNALTSIQHLLLVKDTDKALLYVDEFAKLMREMLENADEDKISLADEINFLNRYLTLEQLRTNHHFKFDIKTSQNLNLEDIFVPSFLFQIPVENAIWHGVLPQKKQGHIQINFEQKNDWLLVEIKDNGKGRFSSKKKNHNSKGLTILKQRIDALNQNNGMNIHWEIEDLKSESGKPKGTKVMLKHLIQE